MSPPMRFPELPNAPAALKAELLITTPMFLGDGGQRATSIRPPSIKGALRFWWRALQWPRLYQRHGQVSSALADLHAQEAELFGLAAGHKKAHSDNSNNHETGGQGRFRIRIAQPEVKLENDYRPPASVQYLLGQGLYNLSDGVLRKPLKQCSRFALELTAKPGRHTVTEAQWKCLEEALLCWGLLGGLGARARKGFGSVSLQTLEGGAYQAPQNREEYETLLQTLLSTLQGQDGKLPPFTAFSSVSRVDIALEGKSTDKVLETLGDEMQMYRAYGYKGYVGKKEAERKFINDHHNVLHAAETGYLLHCPRRVVFGLPHNYKFSSLPSPNNKVDISSDYGEADRRSSPLLLHIHELPNGKALGVGALLPAVFLPAREALKVKARGKTSRLSLHLGDIDWTVLHDYLDRFAQRKSLIAPLIPNAQEAQG
ncbi:type III-B CRISPR module RAMP protein Cmr1 [Halomonas sp. KRD171]|uniref:type III-B CRISPR module RAMP protein Cmr1 n=1 Tax=Halomonas sp. KRD171 TaxID=2729726 RepID=UPI0019D1766D|nr:type III-B CRISPR module RAMP protein Cmr1 [Halomonas sp. KRD171]